MAKMITMPKADYDKACAFTKSYNDTFIESGFSTEERELASMVLAAFNFAMFERVY